MTPLFSKFGKVNVYFTSHARQRIIQRFKLYLTNHERNDPNFFLQNDFKTSKLNMSKHMSPGYVNKRDSMYGKNSFMSKSETMCYFGNYIEHEDRIIVRTVVPIHTMKKEKSK